MLSTVRSAIQGLLTHIREFDSPLKGVGICGFGNGLIIINREGQLIRPIILSGDQRAGEVVEKLNASDESSVIRAIACQQLYAGQLAPLLIWLKENEPEHFKRIHRVMLIKDFIRWKLTGDFATDPTDIGATALCNAETGEYSQNLLKIYGLESIEPCLPRILSSSHSNATVTAPSAKTWGLPTDTPVTIGCIDCEAASIGSGIRSPNQLSMIAGTWAINQSISRQIPKYTNDLFLCSRSARKGYYWLLEGSPTSANNYEWFVDHVFTQESLEARKKNINPYSYCSQIASRTEIKDDHLLFLPFLFGTVGNGSAHTGAIFHGIESHHTRADLIRTVIEGIAFCHRYHVEKLMAASIAFDDGTLSGGLAKDDIVSAIFTDILGFPVNTLMDQNIGAVGAAILAGVGNGVWATIEEAQTTVCKIDQTYEPDPTRNEIYENKFNKFKQLIGQGSE